MAYRGCSETIGSGCYRVQKIVAIVVRDPGVLVPVLVDPVQRAVSVFFSLIEQITLY